MQLSFVSSTPSVRTPDILSFVRFLKVIPSQICAKPKITIMPSHQPPATRLHCGRRTHFSNPQVWSFETYIFFTVSLLSSQLFRVPTVCRRVHIPKPDIQDCHYHNKHRQYQSNSGHHFASSYFTFHFSHILLIYVLLQYSMYKGILNAFFKMKGNLVIKKNYFFNPKKQPIYPYPQ